MPVTTLRVKLETENVAHIRVSEGHSFMLYLKCSNCGEKSEKPSFIDPDAAVPVPGGRGEANLVQKCKMCSRSMNVSVVKDSVATLSGEDEGFQVLAKFECRGCDLEDFEPQGAFVVVGPSGAEFEAEELSDEFAVFDDDEGVPLAIYSVEAEFE